MDKSQVVAALEEIAVLLDLVGENPFKARAYEAAARTVKAIPEDLAKVVKDGRLREFRGIGEHIARDIGELVAAGRCAHLEELRGSFPQGVRDLLKVPGLGPKKVRVLVDELGVGSLGELEYASRENRLVDLPGFGAKTQANVLKGIAGLSAYAGRFLGFRAREEADRIVAALRKVRGTRALEVAGSLRRRKETVKDIDLVAGAGESGPLMDALEKHPLVEGVTARGDTKMSVHLKSGIALDLRVVPPAAFPFALQHFTGSKEHNVALRARAQGRGLKSNEYGLFKGTRSLSCRDEADIYRELGLSYIPPELREDLGELEAAEKGDIPVLVEEKDLLGTLHVHTVASDGAGTLEEMARAAQALGFTWMGITEHSRSARYARGLEADRLRAEGDRIAALNAKGDGFTILHGTEADILDDGSLDYPDKVLAKLDFVIGSVHSHFTLPEKEMTRRLCRALEDPRLTILGHPTGRLLLTRDAYAVDMEAVLACAGKNGKAVELNAHPFRLDLDWRLMRRARELGVPIAICPDAHGAEELAYTFYGVGVARKGWLRKEDVLNTLTARQFMERGRKK